MDGCEDPVDGVTDVDVSVDVDLDDHTCRDTEMQGCGYLLCSIRFWMLIIELTRM